MENLLKHKVESFKGSYICSDLFQNEDYKNFIESIGSGFFFHQSLHIYGVSSDYKFHDIEERTYKLRELYEEVLDLDGYICFAEDIFGNQYITNGQEFIWMTIETGDLEFIANSFNEWFEIVLDDLNYYTGESLIEKWTELHGNLEFQERLTPKIPFVLGGEFVCENLYSNDYVSVLSFNANLAFQILNTPDGTEIDIELV